MTIYLEWDNVYDNGDDDVFETFKTLLVLVNGMCACGEKHLCGHCTQ